MKKIIEILKDPDYVYKESRSSKDYYYEKKFGKSNYRVVITKHKRTVKVVVTGYKLKYSDQFDRKQMYCFYDKNENTLYGENVEENEDIGYFNELFNNPTRKV